MKVPLKWLAEYVALPSSVAELSDRFTAIGHMQDHQPAQVAGDTVLDLEVRQNRSDCLSLVGLAREIAASLQTDLNVPASLETALPNVAQKLAITIQNPESAYRFHAVQIDNVKVADSPEWLRQKVEAYGMKSINNIVDITNFVMIELGEPLHAFDSSEVQDGIVVRMAHQGEKVEVLGGRSLTLTPQDVVIANSADEFIALGGMIGGINSGVHDGTTSIVLEAATYNQANIRRSSLRHSLRTEASLRHEKFLHPHLTEVALRRAVELIKELAGGEVIAHGDAYPEPVEPKTVTVSIPFLHRLTGVAISQRESLDILERLGIVSTAKGADTVSAQIPYFRTDLVQEEDVIEEVLRIHGYDKIPNTLPASSPPPEITSPSYQLEEKIRDILVDYGFDEVITEPLTNEKNPVTTPVVLQNSLNADKTMLRTTLKNQLLEALGYQQKAHKTGVALFEIGQVYARAESEYGERKVLAGVLTDPEMVYLKAKGIVEALFIRLQYVYPETAVTLIKTDAETCYFEVDLSQVAAQPDVKAYRIRTSLAQVLYQDLSLVVPVETKVGEVLQTVAETSPLIYKVTLGESPRQLKAGGKSVFLKLQYHQSEGQVTAQEVEPVRQNILQVLAEKFDATLR
jgi:phenylalanyl-tRNA synthetase beta subunit